MWSDVSFVWRSPQGFCKAPDDSNVPWKQFIMLLEEVLVCGGVSFHPPLHVPGRRRDSRPCDGSAQCQGCLCTAYISSVFGGIEVRPQLGDLQVTAVHAEQLVLAGDSQLEGAYRVDARGEVDDDVDVGRAVCSLPASR